MEHLFLMFLDHTQRRSTVGRTPLDCHNQTSHRQVHQARTHIDNITATYHINEANKQRR